MKEALSLDLRENEVSFLSEMVKSGRFASRAEVVHAGLRLLEDYEHHQKAKRLQVSIAQGDEDIKAGRMTEYTSAKALADAVKGEL